jgi:hypothetical protein
MSLYGDLPAVGGKEDGAKAPVPAFGFAKRTSASNSTIKMAPPQLNKAAAAAKAAAARAIAARTTGKPSVPLMPSMQPRAVVKPVTPPATFAAPRSLTAGKATTTGAGAAKKSKAPAPVFATLGGGEATVVVETLKVIGSLPHISHIR